MLQIDETPEYDPDRDHQDPMMSTGEVGSHQKEGNNALFSILRDLQGTMTNLQGDISSLRGDMHSISERVEACERGTSAPRSTSRVVSRSASASETISRPDVSPICSVISINAGANIRAAIQASPVTPPSRKRPHYSSDSESGEVLDRESQGRAHSSEHPISDSDRGSLTLEKKKKNRGVKRRRKPDVLDKLKQLFEKKKRVGAKVHSDIASTVNEGILKQIDIPKLEKVCERFPPPENIPNLRVPALDSEVDFLLRGYKREQMERLETIQNLVTKSLVASTQLLNVAKQAADQGVNLSRSQISDVATDLTCLQTAAHASINDARKNLVKSCLDYSMRDIVDGEVQEKGDKEENPPPSSNKWLVGGRINESIKKTQEENRHKKVLEGQIAKNEFGGRSQGRDHRPSRQNSNQQYVPRKGPKKHPSTYAPGSVMRHQKGAARYYKEFQGLPLPNKQSRKGAGGSRGQQAHHRR